jgi:site-specific recombinase XerD
MPRPRYHLTASLLSFGTPRPSAYIVPRFFCAPAHPTAGFRKMVARLGIAAKLGFKAHPHIFRHACGFQLANQGTDTRTLRAYLGIATSSTPFVTPNYRQRVSKFVARLKENWQHGMPS